MTRYAVILAASALAFASASASAGCSSDGLTCVEVDGTCSPLYEPTFDNVYRNTLAPTCAPAGRSCHSIEGNAGGIAYGDADSAYEQLMGGVDGHSRVVPFDASCSLLSQRIGSSRASQLMPPGDRLPAAERCAIELWIANGAQR